jgi:hypothetical protein
MDNFSFGIICIGMTFNIPATKATLPKLTPQEIKYFVSNRMPAFLYPPEKT